MPELRCVGCGRIELANHRTWTGADILKTVYMSCSERYFLRGITTGIIDGILCFECTLQYLTLL